MRNNLLIAALGSVSATGATTDYDVRELLRFATVSLLAKNTAGTNPTLDTKLQASDNPAAGQSYTVLGATANELREGASTNTKLSAKFTQSGAKSVKYVDLYLAKEGTIAAGKKLTLTINTNNAGVPSATVVGTASTVDIDTEVSTTAGWVRFTFLTAVDLSDATIYHLVLAGDYTASGSNNVIWYSKTVASAGNQSTNDATNWTAVATESQMFINYDLTFADISGAAFAQVTDAAHATINLTLGDGNARAFLRAHHTIGGTSSPAFMVALLLNAEGRRN